MKRDGRMDSCFLESEGDTEDDEDTDGRDAHAPISHISTSLFTDSHAV